MDRNQQVTFFERFVDAQEQIMLKKGNDYSDNVDRLSNFKRVGEALGMSPEKVCLVLIMVKVARLDQLLAYDRTPNNETVEDSFVDLCNYGMLLAMLNSERKE